jgi:hypothetical protein
VAGLPVPMTVTSALNAIAHAVVYTEHAVADLLAL